MKFSERWLREYVNPDLSTDELVSQLTMAGLEVDGFEPVAGEFHGLVIGEILEVQPHPDADKLVVCRVNSGDEERQVVCGAPNARAGIKVPFALVGAQIEDLKIKKAKLRGVESFGMLCSERELGLSDNHEGLMELPGDAPVGQDIRDYLQLDDVTIDLDLTPNRSDCLGMLGLARETGLMNNLDVTYPVIEPVPAEIEDVQAVNLQAPAACSRFVGRVIRDVDVSAKSPLWMREKLRRAGLRSIDPVVDITNYIMLELNHPMHAYDLDKLSGDITVRLSEAGEQIELLDESTVKLEAGTVLITDASGAIGMGGVMGGLSTSVTTGTKHIYFECAFFAPTAIAGKARSYGMNTDAAHRFERGVDWQGQMQAVERATQLLIDIAGGKPGPLVDTVANESLPINAPVRLRASKAASLLGVTVPNTEIENILSRLGFAHEAVGEGEWLVTAPSHRFDIAIEADLIEEISRVYGYNNLPVQMPQARLDMTAASEQQLNVEKIRDQLVSRGYFEAMTYGFVDPALQAKMDPVNEAIELANPLSSEMSVMRTSILQGLLKSLIYNHNRQQERIRLFEIGLIFQQSPNQPELALKNIRQEKMLAGVVAGSRQATNWASEAQPVDFFDVKGDLETILGLSDLDVFEFRAARHPGMHQGQCAEVLRGDNSVGFVGLIDPTLQQVLDIDVPIYLFELKIDELITKSVHQASPLSRFPEIHRDIAVVVDAMTSASAVIGCVKSEAGEHLQNLKLFDVYQGKGIETTRKSLGLGLTFQHGSRNLTSEEIDATMDSIVAALKKELGATLRT